MSTYEKYNAGMQLVDVGKNEAGYNYYGYLHWGEDTRWAILREKTDGTEYRWLIGNSDYETAWTNHTTLTGWKRAFGR